MQPAEDNRVARNGLWLRVAGTVGAHFLAAWALAAGFTLQTMRVPISVDGQYISSSMFLDFQARSYGVPFAIFDAHTVDEREVAFAQIVSAVRNNNSIKAAQLWTPPAQKLQDNGKTGTVVPLTNASAEDFVALYRSAFLNFENVQVISDIRVGSRDLFVWDPQAPGRPRRRGFSVGAKDDKVVVQEVTSGSPVELLIVNWMDEVAKNPQAYQSAVTPKLKYHYAIPVDGPHDPGKYPVVLGFDGESIDFDVFNAAVAAPSPVLAFYRSAYLALKGRSIESFIQMHTEKSQDKLRKWLATMSKEEFEKFYLSTVGGRYVKFVLNADPVYIVFYGPQKGRTWLPGSLSYQYILRDPKTRQLKLTNVFFLSFFDDFLQNTNLFDQRFLKPLSAPSVRTAAR
ncbi:MAG TPA: hypothetical protein VKM93_02740 [Terriglobia bacterium]|nr:hypothetical protein [Terriglobia bacterium]